MRRCDATPRCALASVRHRSSCEYVTGNRCRILWLAQRAERRPDLGREQLRLFPGGEVAALVGLVEVGDVGVRLLDPAARGPEDLAGERGEADRELDLRTRLSGRMSCGLCVLPVRPG